MPSFVVDWISHQAKRERAHKLVGNCRIIDVAAVAVFHCVGYDALFVSKQVYLSISTLFVAKILSHLYYDHGKFGTCCGISSKVMCAAHSSEAAIGKGIKRLS